MRRYLLLTILLFAVAACGPSRSDLQQFERMRTATDPRANAAETIDCGATDLLCVRLLVLRGAACMQLAEAADVATRVRSRSCALEDFRAAQRQLPADAPADDRRKVLVGLAEAEKISRDNAADNAAAADLNRQLAAAAGSLRPVQGGAPFAAYFEADSMVFRSLREGMADANACRTLREARGMLPAGATPPDLARRVSGLRITIDSAIQSRRCG